MKFTYTTSFSELSIKPLVSEEKDKFLATASLKEISKFIPNINIKKNTDLLPVAFNACVVNRVNKNDDVINTETALANYKEFLNKPINIEHNRQRIIGVILSAGFSEFGTDKPLTEDEVRGTNKPFNIVLGGLVWKSVNKPLCELIEESNDPTSKLYLSVSASWELGFDDYRIIEINGANKNLENSSLIPESNEEEMDKLLKANGGSGSLENGNRIYRMPINKVLPLGIGFTEKPAADVKGVAVNQKKEQKESQSSENNDNIKNNISQVNKSNVKIEREHKKVMLNSIKDITDEYLKEAKASEISDLFTKELKKANESFLQEKNGVLAEKKQIEEKLTASETKVTELNQKVTELNKSVDSLTKESDDRKKVDTFNVRMASIAELYDLDDEASKIVAEEIRSLNSDEDFTKWENKAKVFLKGYAKTKKADKKDNKKEEMEEEKKENESKASAEQVVDEAVDNGKKQGGTANSSESQKNLMETYAKAFDLDQFVIKL